MAHAFDVAGSGAFGSSRRFAARRRGIDWRVVAMTAVCAVLLIAMLGQPI